MEERLPRRREVRSVVYRRAFEDILPGRAFFTRSCGGRGVVRRPRSPREQGRECHETLVATAPQRQPHILQRGQHGRLTAFFIGLRASASGGFNGGLGTRASDDYLGR
ncbi:unnamed protein product [Ectocarpus sp. 12 AP-2014]